MGIYNGKWPTLPSQEAELGPDSQRPKQKSQGWARKGAWGSRRTDMQSIYIFTAFIYGSWFYGLYRFALNLCISRGSCYAITNSRVTEINRSRILCGRRSVMVIWRRRLLLQTYDKRSNVHFVARENLFNSFAYLHHVFIFSYSKRHGESIHGLVPNVLLEPVVPSGIRLLKHQSFWTTLQTSAIAEFLRQELKQTTPGPSMDAETNVVRQGRTVGPTIELAHSLIPVNAQTGTLKKR